MKSISQRETFDRKTAYIVIRLLIIVEKNNYISNKSQALVGIHEKYIYF